MPYQDGKRYFVTHDRRYEPKANPTDVDVMSEFGGSTRVEILADGPGVDGTWTVVAVGVANCSRRDRFNRKLGVTIARGRAFKNLRLGVPPVPEGCTGRYEVRVGVVHDDGEETCPVHGGVRSAPELKVVH